MDANAVIVGEFELPFVRKDWIRVGSNAEWQPIRDFLQRGSGWFFHAIAFTANDGMRYTWEPARCGLIMTRASSSEVLIVYHRNKQDTSYLEIVESSVQDDLDTIILTLISERRRTGQKRRNAAIAGALSRAAAA